MPQSNSSHIKFKSLREKHLLFTQCAWLNSIYQITSQNWHAYWSKLVENSSYFYLSLTTTYQLPRLKDFDILRASTLLKSRTLCIKTLTIVGLGSMHKFHFVLLGYYQFCFTINESLTKMISILHVDFNDFMFKTGFSSDI